MGRHRSAHDRKLAILSEAQVASKPKEWSGYFHLTALATMLGRSVFSSYPNCQTWIRDFVHGIIYPQMATFSVEPVFLLWSREGSDNRPGAWYEPNDFVPLYSAEASDGLRTCNALTQMSSINIHTLKSSHQIVLSNQCSAMPVHSWQRRHLVQTYPRKVERKSLRLKR